MNTKRLPPPWTVIEHAESYEVRDANGTRIAFVYFEEEVTRRQIQNRLTQDQARRVAAHIARIPDYARPPQRDEDGT